MQTILKLKATSPLVSWLSYLEQLHNTTIDLGLDRIQQVAERLELLHPAPLVITVAGTNGKGTTCRTLEAILMAAGYRVGVYSSPHLIRYTERVRIQGEEQPEQAHTQSFEQIDVARGEISLTYFEFGTLSALYQFKQAKVDVAILEVGLGGRLDATNIVDADVAVITSIDLDHTDWLGSNRDSIGREKAGIFRMNKPAVVGEPNPPESIIQVAKQVGANLYQYTKDWQYQLTGETWCWQSGDHKLEQLPLPRVPLANAATALAALSYLPLTITTSAIHQGLADAALPGRFQIVSRKPLLILDVAHNPHAAAYLATRLQQEAMMSANSRTLAVVGMLADKEIKGTLQHLLPLVSDWYCAPLDGPRGTRAEDIAKCLVNTPNSPKLFTSVGSAWLQAMSDATPQDRVIVFGSFHTVAHIIEMIEAGENGNE